MISIIFNLFYIYILMTVTAYVIKFFSDYVSSHVESNRWAYLILGSFGVSLHELSHFLLALVFRHDIKRVKWFDSQSQTAGVVEHSYNPNNLYQRLGNYFIALAPMFVMGFLSYLILRFTVDVEFDSDFIRIFPIYFDIIGFTKQFIQIIFNFLTLMYQSVFELNGLYFIGVFLIISMSIFAGPSNADLSDYITNSMLNFGLVFIVLLAMYYIHMPTFILFTNGIEFTINIMASFLMLLISISAFFSAIIYLFKLI